MTIAITLLIMIVLGASSAYLLFRYSCRNPADQSEYARRRPLNTHEQELYWRLVKTLPDYAILAQVAMKRCVAARGSNAKIIARESLDFVVCNQSMRIVAVIEIVDDTHTRSEYREKVRMVKEEALESAGIRLITCSSRSLLSEAYISMEFNNHSSLIARLVA